MSACNVRAQREQLMTEGARVAVEADVGFFEVPQYPWPSAQALTEGILECDRHLAIGALEYVPAGEVAAVQATSQIHPWTVVAQGPDKWRACLDMSVGLNRDVRSMPFGLPTVWDVRRVVKPTSCFAKADLRDGFFSVPIHPGSRNRFVMRHPGTGRLMRCARLPFGYVDSPRLFCSVTESCQLEAEQALRAVQQQLMGADESEAVDATAAARAHSIWARLEREYALSEGRADAEAGGLLLPRHSRAAFVAFLDWMASDAERARSLTHVRLASRTFRAQTQLTDWCVDDEVASMLGRLEVQGVE